MNVCKTLLTSVVFIACVGLARAGDLAGKWTSEFDSQIGPQKYAYEFKAEDGKLTGKAHYDHSMGQGDSALSDIKVNGDEVAFTETVDLNGMELVITYEGKFVGDEIHLKRTVGDFAVEQVVLKRKQETADKDAA